MREYRVQILDSVCTLLIAIGVSVLLWYCNDLRNDVKQLQEEVKNLKQAK